MGDKVGVKRINKYIRKPHANLLEFQTKTFVDFYELKLNSKYNELFWRSTMKFLLVQTIF